MALGLFYTIWIWILSQPGGGGCLLFACVGVYLRALVLEPHLLLLINMCAGAGISSHVSFSIFLRSLRRQSLLASAVPEH